MKKKEIKVTIDRLKPSYIIADDFPKMDTSRNTQEYPFQKRIRGHVPAEKFIFQTVFK